MHSYRALYDSFVKIVVAHPTVIEPQLSLATSRCFVTSVEQQLDA